LHLVETQLVHGGSIQAIGGTVATENRTPNLDHCLTSGSWET
jgi:hypothetical protein